MTPYLGVNHGRFRYLTPYLVPMVSANTKYCVNENLQHIFTEKLSTDFHKSRVGWQTSAIRCYMTQGLVVRPVGDTV